MAREEGNNYSGWKNWYSDAPWKRRSRNYGSSGGYWNGYRDRRSSRKDYNKGWSQPAWAGDDAQQCEVEGCPGWKANDSKEGMCRYCSTTWPQAGGEPGEDSQRGGAAQRHDNSESREELVGMLCKALETDVRSLLAQHLEAANTAQ